MTDQPRQSNFEIVPQPPLMPIYKSMFVGRHSHILAGILGVSGLVSAGFHLLPKDYWLFFSIGLILIWWLLRFGYQITITRLIHAHNYEKALSMCLKMMKIFPDDAYLWVNTADAYWGVKQFEQALELAEKAIRYGERLPLAYLVKTKTLIALQQAKDTQELNLIEMDSQTVNKNGDIQLMRADLTERKHKNDRVLAQMDQIYRTPNLVPPFLQISYASFLARLGRLDLAQEELDKVGDCKNNTARAYWLGCQSRIFLLGGDSKAALEAATQAKQLLPNDWSILSTQALMLLRNKQFEEAKLTFDKAINEAGELKDLPFEAYYYRAEILEQNGDHERADKDRKLAVNSGYIPHY